ncbi:MAG: holo-ACP synthase [bacterium]
MSVRAVGIDLLEVERMARAVDRWGQRFLDRVFTPGEQEAARRGSAAEALAARYAAKEAVSKCLGTGFEQGVRRRDIEVVGDERGAPSIRLHGAAARRAGGARFMLSMTHTEGMAACVAVMLSSEPNG